MATLLVLSEKGGRDRERERERERERDRERQRQRQIHQFVLNPTAQRQQTHSFYYLNIFMQRVVTTQKKKEKRKRPVSVL